MKKIIISVITFLLVLSGCGVSKESIAEEITNMLSEVEPTRIGVYVNNNDEITFEDLKDSTFVYQTVLSKGQDAAIQYIKDITRWSELKTEEVDSIYKMVRDFAESSEGKAIIIDNAYVDALKNNEKTREYVKDLRLVWEYDDVNAYDFSLVNNPFQVYIIGSDDRAVEINENSHYDVDILLTVNPKTKQVLVLSIPRDTYVKNFAHDENRDKLDYTGMAGLDNAKKAINEMFNQQISLYVLTNFTEFMNLVDILGGVEVYNPYSFSTTHGYTNGRTIKVNYYFPEGTVYLDGIHALAFARERSSLYDWAGSPVGKYNGDMARNMHHLLLMKSIIGKMISLETLANYENLMEQIKNCFHTNISFSQMYALAIMQFTEHPDWNIVYQHIFDEYVSDICASEPDLGPLTVGIPDENDLAYVIDLMNKVMAGETITQEPIPSENY